MLTLGGATHSKRFLSHLNALLCGIMSNKKKVVSDSGGRSSKFLAKFMLDKYGKDNVDFVFMDTGEEHEETYKFIRSCNKAFGLDLTCLRGDFSLPIGAGVGYRVVSIDDIKPDSKPFEEMMAKYGVPYIGGMFCTDRMKLKPYKKYCDKTYGKNNYETWLGVRYDEPKRLVGDNKNKELSAYKQLKIDGLNDDCISLLYVNAREDIKELDRWQISDLSKALLVKRIDYLNKENLHYLAEICEHEKEDILSFWSEMPFDLQCDEWSGNCKFCPKKSDLKLAASKIDSPQGYDNFNRSLRSDSVRVDDNTGHYSKMYRGKQSLVSLIARFVGLTGDEIKTRIRGGKMIDANSCSESCEVFN